MERSDVDVFFSEDRPVYESLVEYAEFLNEHQKLIDCFVESILEYQDDLGYTDRRMAKALDISRAQWNRWKCGIEAPEEYFWDGIYSRLEEEGRDWAAS
jgi:hypothetical protein